MIVACINFLVLIISSRYLGVETRGQISLLILNIANVQMLSEIFTGYASVYFIPRFSLNKLFYFGIVWIVLILLLGTLILYYLNYLIPHDEVEFVIISAMVILNTFCMVIILGKENIRLYNWLSVLQPLLLLIVLFFNIFVEKKYVLDSYFDALFYSFAVVLVINIFTVVQYLKINTLSEFHLKPIFANGFLSQWSNWMHLLANRFSYYILSAIALNQLGIYSTASSLIESVFVIYSGISTVVLSYVSNESDTDKSKHLTIKAAAASFILTVLALLIILLIPEKWILWVLGKNFQNIKLPMMLLSGGVMMIAYSAVFSHYFSGKGVLKFNAISNTIACLFTLIFSHFFVQHWGIPGAAVLASISYSIEAIFVIYFFVRYEQIRLNELLNFFSVIKLFSYLKNIVTKSTRNNPMT